MAINISSQAVVDQERGARNRNIRNALITSVFARISGVLLQVISLPIAAKQLGPVGFSIYAMLGTILAAMTLSNLGMSQATTLHMSRALAAGKNVAARKLLTVSFVIVGGVASIVSAIAATLIIFTPILSLVFAQHRVNSSELVTAALFVCFVFLITQLLSVLEAAQVAQQRQHRLNITMTVGTVVAAGAVWWATKSEPSVEAILFAVHLPVIAVRTVNAIWVWTNLRPRAKDLATSAQGFRNIFGDGLHFVSGATVANFLCHSFSVLIVGIHATPQVSASFAAVMNGIILASSVLSLIVTPFRGALPEAYTRGDYSWVRKAWMRMLGASLAYGCLVCIVFGVFGQWLFRIWYGGSMNPKQIELLGAAIYFLMLAVEVTNFSYLSGVGSLRSGARWLLVKSIFAAFAVFGAAVFAKVHLVFWILIGTNFVFSLIPLGRIGLKISPIVRGANG